MTTPSQSGNVELVLLDNGNIQLKFRVGTADLFSDLTPEQSASLASMLLQAVHSSAILTGLLPPSPPGQMAVNTVFPVRHWGFGQTHGRESSKAAILHVGNSVLGVTIAEDRMREFGRAFVNASWRSGSRATLFSLAQMILKDVCSDVAGWWAICKARARNEGAYHYRRLATWFRGESFSLFRSVEIGKDIPVPEYDRVNGCIYCDAAVYSTIPGDRAFPFGGEHIVAEGIGGTLELPEASCRACETATGAVVESDILGRTLKAMRVHLKLKKAGSGPHPKVLPLETTANGQTKILDLPVEDYPIVFMMLSYGPLDLEREGGTPPTFGATVVTLKYDHDNLFKKYRVIGFSSAYWDNHMLCRMLAKIAHSFATAELPAKPFTPRLTGMIRTGDMSASGHIGSDQDMRAEPTSALHVLQLGYQRIKKKTYVVARIRLFASHGGPTYLVAVGESLEHSIVRAKRVFSSRISRALGR